MTYRVEITETEPGFFSMGVRTPEGLRIAPVLEGSVPDIEVYRAMLQDFAEALQAARDWREGVRPGTRPDPSPPTTAEAWWEQQSPARRTRLFRDASIPEAEARALAEVSYANLSARLKDLILARFNQTKAEMSPRTPLP